jgi:predicted nuclease of predicted toxin-antitoxin system
VGKGGVRLVFDAQLPPRIAAWTAKRFSVECLTLSDAHLQGARDAAIFQSLHAQGDVIVTKDEDFVSLVRTHKPPPQVLWVRCGNVTNRALKARFEAELERALGRLRAGDSVVQIAD